MLKLMRERFHSLKVLLWLVVGSFVITIFAVWGGAREAARGGATATWAARVDGEEIPAALFRQRVRNLDNFYRQLYGSGYAQQRPTLRVGETVAQDLINNRLVVREARRLGLLPTVDDLTRRITEIPQFQGPDGRFIGRQRYQELLRANGLDVAAFEREQMEALTVERFKNVVFDALSVGDLELEDELRRRNEKTRVAVLRVPLERYRSDTSPSEVDLQAHLERHPQRFRRGESRRGRVLILSREKVGGEIQVSEKESRQQYERERDTRFTRQEQRRASHILLKVEASAPQAEVDRVRRRAEKLLAQARGGADFAALARASSEDPGSAAQGGDLGFFGRGAMVAEFESAAFSLPIGQISDLVRSSFGFHIIKVTGEQPAGVVPFEEARPGIERALQFQRVQEEMTRRARTWTERLRAGDSADELAGEAKIEVQDTGYLTREERGGAATPGVVQAMFALEPEGASEPLAVPEGLAVVQLVEIRPAAVPPLAEARAQVEADWKREQAVERGRRALEAAGLYGPSAPAPAAAARALSGEIVETPLFLRSEAPEQVPASLRAAAFSTPGGAWSQPVAEGEHLVALHVLQRPPLDLATLAASRDGLRRSLVFQKRNLLYNQILEKLRSGSDLELNQPLIALADQG
jgi:peptidyl-prolyl cis-trans isomerase D